MAAELHVLPLSWSHLLRGEGSQRGRGDPGGTFRGTRRAILGLESMGSTMSGRGVITGDHPGFRKLKRAQATSSAEGEINRLIYGTQMRALPGRYSL